MLTHVTRWSSVHDVDATAAAAHALAAAANDG
jgi:hypothetical protein